MPFTDLPIDTSISTGFSGLPQTSSPPTNLQKWNFFMQFMRAISERMRASNCAGEFPPPNDSWGTAIAASVVVGTGANEFIITCNDVDWHVPSGFSGTRWVAYESSDPDLCYLPRDYDIVVEGDETDPYTVIRMHIKENTWDGVSSGTLTVDGLYALNAVTAKFIGPDVISWLTSKTLNFMKAGPPGGLWRTDREFTKPNERELWRGTALAGWIDSSGKGHVEQKINDFNPDPYNKDVAPDVNWKFNFWKTREILAFDENGILHRAAITGNNATVIAFGNQIYQINLTATSGTFFLGLEIDGSLHAVGPLNWNDSAGTIGTAIVAAGGTGATVSGTNPWVVTFPSALGTTVLKAGVVSAGTMTVGKPDASLAINGIYAIIIAGDKEFPGRGLDELYVYYTGVMRGFQSHDVDDRRNQVFKPSAFAVWRDLNNDNECVNFEHLAYDVDTKIEDQNVCECSRAADYLSQKFYCNLRELQRVCIGLLGRFVDTFNNFGDDSTIRIFTPATWALGYQTTYGVPLHAWSTTVAVSGGIGTVASTNAAPYYPIAVFWTIEDSHQAIVAQGIASMDSGGVIGPIGPSVDGFTISLWFGFSKFYRRRAKYIESKEVFTPDAIDGTLLDPPAVTPGGELTTPTGVTLAQKKGGGTLHASVPYTYRVSAINGSGETIPSADVAITAGLLGDTSNTYSITIKWDSEIGASGFNIYGRASGSEKLMFTTSAYETSWTDDGSIDVTGLTIDPPTSNTTHNDCWGVGTWIHRDTSSQYVSRDSFGFREEGGPNSPAFIAGQYVRNVGDNFFDPFSGRGPIDTILDDAEYWDRFYRGKYKRQTELLYRIPQSGRPTSGTHYSLTVAGKDWFTDTVLNFGELRIQGGIATGGSTSTLQDSDYNTGNKSCWFASGRYAGSLGGVGATPFSFFVIEIYSGGLPDGWTVSADGTATWSGDEQPEPDSKVPVMSFATGTFTFANVIATAVAAGDGYLIREPRYELNRYRGRTAIIVKSDGTTIKLVIRFSDKNSLYFDTQTFIFDTILSFLIEELGTGNTLKFATTKPSDLTTKWIEIAANKYWVQPVGSDSRGADFLPDMHANLETKVVDYGYWMADDDVGPHLFNELYYVIRSMQTTLQEVDGFIKAADPDVPEIFFGNATTPSTYSNGDPTGTFADADFIPPACTDRAETRADGKTVIDYTVIPGNFYCGGIDFEYWTTTTGTGPLTGLPFTDSHFGCEEGFQLIGGVYEPSTDDTGQGYSLQARAGYATALVGCPGLTASARFCAFAIIPGGDPTIGPEPGDAGTAEEPNVFAFNDYGTGLLWRKWKVWSTVSGGNGTTPLISAQLGDASTYHLPAAIYPNEPDPVANFLYGSANREGFLVTQTKVLVDWDFEYV